MRQAPERRPEPGERRMLSPRLVLGLGVVEVVLIALGLMAFRYTRPVPAFTATADFAGPLSAQAPPGELPWPGDGQAALAVDGLGIVATHGGDTPQPIASTTKIMTALLILEHHPLQPGEKGPTVTLTQEDVDRYNEAVAEDQSVVGVAQGEVISEYELLQGLLLPSGNNFAEILAKWDAGSIPAFVDQMNARAKELGMTATHYDDSSGFSAKTVSRPSDLLLLAQAAMAQPVFADIVSQRKATLPVAGEVDSTNEILGEAGIDGIKTGETDEAGACLVFSAIVRGANGDHRVYGVVLGQRTRGQVFDASKALAAAAAPWITATRVVSKGQPAGSFRAPWGGATQAVAARDIDVSAWGGEAIRADVKLDALAGSIAAGAKVGELTVTAGGRSSTSDLVAATSVSGPGVSWRLWR